MLLFRLDTSDEPASPNEQRSQSTLAVDILPYGVVPSTSNVRESEIIRVLDETVVMKDTVTPGSGVVGPRKHLPEAAKIMFPPVIVRPHTFTLVILDFRFRI